MFNMIDKMLLKVTRVVMVEGPTAPLLNKTLERRDVDVIKRCYGAAVGVIKETDSAASSRLRKLNLN